MGVAGSDVALREVTLTQAVGCKGQRGVPGRQLAVVPGFVQELLLELEGLREKRHGGLNGWHINDHVSEFHRWRRGWVNDWRGEC